MLQERYPYDFGLVGPWEPCDETCGTRIVHIDRSLVVTEKKSTSSRVKLRRCDLILCGQTNLTNQGTLHIVP